MSDQRDQPEPPDETEPVPVGDGDGDASVDGEPTETVDTVPPAPPDLDGGDEPEPLHIAEQTPPPPPPPLRDDEAPFVADEPVHEPVEPQPTEVAPRPAAPVATVPVGPGRDPVVDPPVAADDRWPSSAKATAAILAVLAVGAIIAAIVGFSRASSAEDDASTTSQDVAAAEERAQNAESQLATAQAESAASAASAEQVDQLTAERDAAIARAEESESAAALFEQALTEQEAENEQLAADLATSEENLASLTGDIEQLFPVTISPDLASLDLAGPYNVTLTEVSCVGLELCGSPPQLGSSTLSSEGGGLRLVVPDRLNVPLVAVGGSLFGVADEQELVPPCGDVPRSPALTMGLFGDAATLGPDGDLSVTALAGSVLIDVPAVDDCPVGRVWYRAQLDSAG